MNSKIWLFSFDKLHTVFNFHLTHSTCSLFEKIWKQTVRSKYHLAFLKQKPIFILLLILKVLFLCALYLQLVADLPRFIIDNSPIWIVKQNHRCLPLFQTNEKCCFQRKQFSSFRHYFWTPICSSWRGRH